MNALTQILEKIIDWLRSLFGERKEGSDMGIWKPEHQCQDFTKCSIVIAGHPATVNAAYRDKFELLDFWLGLNNLDQHITRVDSFACRLIRNGNSWSYHSYGQAIDINPEDFPMSQNRYALPQWYQAVLDIARGIGFTCGADWNTIFDPMHLQIGTKIDRKDGVV